MAFRSLKKKFQKKKSSRSLINGANLKSQADDSHDHTSRTLVSDSQVEGTSEVEQPSMYGYEDAAPDTALKNSSSRNLSLDPYGYELHEPSPVVARPRRSSMKGSAGPARGPRRRHSISFQEEAKVNNVVPIATMVKDKGDMWLQGEDYYKIINKVNTIVEKSATGKGQKLCVRGLEHMIQKQAGMEDEPRAEAWDTVLDEQHIQQATGDYDEEMLSRKYKSCAKRSQKEAKLRALQDEQEISKYLEDTRRYCRRMSM